MTKKEKSVVIAVKESLAAVLDHIQTWADDNKITADYSDMSLEIINAKDALGKLVGESPELES